jgi:hypothetical protein
MTHDEFEPPQSTQPGAIVIRHSSFVIVSSQAVEIDKDFPGA